ncbi:hypothetical protein CIHG_07935 [Coccidioides immitis H538.4]|uniref:Uncharacterized protein n=3 Tax=Coccidioides immitis TaxID=5501 RepID=A0A0J8U3H8_COCIT|nr:hypothetical protein CIRG_10145 [Coccidioides immitis RMSCC 2394]KMU81327.1 hypothetical protein CISG_08738 [Coccidioides immitis RMSCC 3703]KMU90125.1 hypothetical protein CIHG_07935 [Coccidioides immitis H538.4]
MGRGEDEAERHLPGSVSIVAGALQPAQQEQSTRWLAPGSRHVVLEDASVQGTRRLEILWLVRRVVHIAICRSQKGAFMLIENGQQPNRTPRHENGSETAELPSDITLGTSGVLGSEPSPVHELVRGSQSALGKQHAWPSLQVHSAVSFRVSAVKRGIGLCAVPHGPTLDQYGPDKRLVPLFGPMIPGFEYYPSRSQSAPCPLTEYPSKGLVDYQRHSRPTGRPDG